MKLVTAEIIFDTCDWRLNVRKTHAQVSSQRSECESLNPIFKVLFASPLEAFLSHPEAKSVTVSLGLRL